MLEELEALLGGDPRIAYALVFGSAARGTMHPLSDIDIAIGLHDHQRLEATELGELAAHLERGGRRRVDIVLLDEAGPGLAYRIFRDGKVLAVRDESALRRRRARAVLEYLDFRPIEDLCASGVLAATHGR